MSKKKLFFPKNFLWGTATSAHQVEGGNIWNDWHLFEQAGKISNKEISGSACNQYQLFKNDFDLAKSLGQNAHRISIEWSRIEKTKGVFDEEEIKHYIDVLKYLKENGFTTFVTLHHFTNPIWFIEKGGWERKESIDCFVRFARFAVENLGEYVDFWSTFNEPYGPYATQGWLQGNWPPEKRNPILMFMVLSNIVKSHNSAYEAIKRINKNYKVGIVSNNGILYTNKIFKPLERIANYFINFFLLDKVIAKCDYLGVNHYFSISDLKNKKVTSRNDLGWPINPQAFYDTIMLISRRYPDLPIYITENGIADNKDTKREKFIQDNLIMLHKSILDGADVRSYFHWSLIDSFEWKYGFSPRFGLVEIDYKTQERIPRPSAYYYKNICETNSIEI